MLSRPKRQIKDTEESYLDKLAFDKKLYGSFIYKFISNFRVVFLLILSIVIAGAVSYTSLPRELNPEVKIPIVTVTTILPGANPLDVEQLITNKLEKEINTITSIEELSSTSRQGVSTIVALFESSQDPETSLAEVKDRVDAVSDLPADAATPIVTSVDFSDVPVVRVAIVGDTDRRSLSKIARQIADQLEKLQSVRRVDLTGQETEEIVVQITPDLLQLYGLSSFQISQAVSTNNITFPAGNIQINQTQYQLTLDGSIDSIEKLRLTPIAVSGQSVLLGDIAQIYYQAKPTDSLTYFSDGESRSLNAVELSVYKTSDATIAGTATQSIETIDEIIRNYPEVKTVTILDFSKEIDSQFDDLTNNFASTIALVFIILMIFIGLKQALIASLSIPLTFLAVFAIMQAFGITLNFLSLFSLLLALGLVVDDAIVVVQAAYRYSQKFKPIEAGLLVFRDFSIPVLTTTITKVWAFLPLLLATGIIGEFIKTIPIVVTSTLVSSTFIAIFINLPLVVAINNSKIPKRVKALGVFFLVVVSTAALAQIMSGSNFFVIAVLLWWISLFLFVWARKELTGQIRNSMLKAGIIKPTTNLSGLRQIYGRGFIDFNSVANKYKEILSKLVQTARYRVYVYLVCGLIFILSMVFLATGILKTEFFPKTDQDQIYVNVEGPPGWTKETTAQTLEEIEGVVLKYPEVRQTILKSSALYGTGEIGSHLGNITVVLQEEGQRQTSSTDLAADMRRQLDNYPGVRVSVEETTSGPPVGADLEVSIRGQDLEELERVSGDFMKALSEIPGAVNIDSTLRQSPGQIAITLNPIKLQEKGLSAAAVGGWLRTAVSGGGAGEVVINQEDYEITLRLNDTPKGLSYLQNMVVPSISGQYTLSEIAEFNLATSPTVINHIDMLREVKVTAAAENISATELLRLFEEKVGDYEIPTDITWQVGGVNQENEASTRSIIMAMGLSAVLILVTMVLQLNSFRKAVMVLSVIPLAVSGVFFNFTLFGIPLSFPALIGVLALFGIVVNNSIILMDKINQNLRFGLKFSSAIVDACSTRVEAIFFTSITTAIGLLPITLSDPFWRGLGGAIIAGLSVSGLFILFLLPSLYVDIYKNSDENK